MGANNSKAKIQALEQRQESLMREHADMAKRLADEREANQKQHEAALEQMAQVMMLALIAAQAQSDDSKQKKQQIEVEGVVYDIVGLIGEGGFGKIYKARSHDDGRFVAIKVMKNSPMIQQEIENEIRFLRATQKVPLKPHPVIEYYGCNVTPDLIFISLELAQCDVLTFWFKEMVNRSEEEQFTFGLVIIMYTLRALTFLERLNIIHGDIKPQNLVIVGDGDSLCVKLIDFGTVEKMQTMRSVVTVDASKAHTQFFASPEFLRRDGNNMISRRLHKKSDAWAAGVMFYLLFLRKLPWNDDYEYHNFVNDPRARDIVVPGEGGYKLIIELLLKKDPDERASAKETLLQMKAHPVLGKLVAALEEIFYPADDVCHVRIPDSIREQMADFATPNQRAHLASSTTSAASSYTRSGGRGGPRRSCRYGGGCYRKNAEHREEFAHPGDSDYRADKGAGKTQCRYGAGCYRTKNAEHTAKYSHN